MFEGARICAGKFIVTIDPDDARDFDDAINVERTPGGGWGSASTSRTWPPTSCREARSIAKRYKRGNSVYLPIASSRCCRSA
jgi:hypothetical protein